MRHLASSRHSPSWGQITLTWPLGDINLMGTQRAFMQGVGEEPSIRHPVCDLTHLPGIRLRRSSPPAACGCGSGPDGGSVGRIFSGLPKAMLCGHGAGAIEV